MKVLQLEHPIDTHLKPIKTDETNTSLEISTDKISVKDLEVTGTTTGVIDSVPLGAYSKTLIKLMPMDFFANDDYNRGWVWVEDDTADTLGVRLTHSNTEAYAFVKIPNGYKATHVQVLASASTSNAVECKTFNYTTVATTDLETFDFN